MKKLLFTIFVCSTLSAGMFDNVINPNGKPGVLTLGFGVNPSATLPITNWMTIKYKRYSYDYSDNNSNNSYTLSSDWERIHTIDDVERTVGWMVDEVGYEFIDGEMYGLIEDMTATAFVTDIDTEYHFIYQYTLNKNEHNNNEAKNIAIDDIVIEIHIPLWGTK